MLEKLSLRGYRGFDAYELGGFGRVNLVVGKNNCGKTTVLEAIELVGTDGDPWMLFQSSIRREEGVRRSGASILHTASVAHLFHGHECQAGASFELAADDVDALSVGLVPWEVVDEDGLRWERTRGPADDEPPHWGLTVRTCAQDEPAVLPVAEDGSVVVPRSRAAARLDSRTRFMSLTKHTPPFLGRAWDDLVASGDEGQVAEDMRLLDPEIESIHFLTSGGYSGNGIVIGCRGRSARIPIGSFGDGLRRLLHLRLSLAATEGSLLLIDEIDTGLHWTIMEAMWRLVVQVAVRLNLQVFATTHSYDCIRGLSSMLEANPDLATEVSVQKVDTLLDQAVAIAGQQIPVAVDQGIELR